MKMAGGRRAAVGAWPDSGAYGGWKWRSSSVRVGSRATRDPSRQRRIARWPLSDPDGVCVRGPWIISLDWPQTTKEARSRGEAQTVLEAEAAGLAGIEEVGGAFELRSDVCSMNLRLHRQEDIFPWLKQPICRCFIPTKRVGQSRCVQASDEDDQTKFMASGEMLPGACSMVVKKFLTAKAVIIEIKEPELRPST